MLTEGALERHPAFLENAPGRRVVAVALRMHPVERQYTEAVLDDRSHRLGCVPAPPVVDRAPVAELGPPVLLALEEGDPPADFVRLTEAEHEDTGRAPPGGPARGPHPPARGAGSRAAVPPRPAKARADRGERL